MVTREHLQYEKVKLKLFIKTSALNVNGTKELNIINLTNKKLINLASTSTSNGLPSIR